MNILAVETGTSWQSIALIREKYVLAHLAQEAKGSHTKLLLPAIHQVLSSQLLKPSDLNGLAVSIGPGSFSGLRVGLATMTAFRMALAIPLVTVPTLEALAWNLRREKLPICPILKARSGVVYWACFRWEGDNIVQIVPEQVGSLIDLVQSLSEPTMVLGEGWMSNREAFLNMSKLMKEAPIGVMNASAINVGLASISRFKTGNFAEFGLGPHYVQPSYAEMKIG
jgi:tRNA threonylcarbamoyladenosine biosynthesis protein TsaB